MTVIVIKREDGGVRLASGNRRKHETDAEYVERIKHDVITKSGVKPEDILGITSTLPEGNPEEWEMEGGEPVLKVQPGKRNHRESWQWDSGRVVINETKANAELWESVRRVRGELLAASDIEIMIANEKRSANVEQLKQYRQALRDVPQSTTNPRSINWPRKSDGISSKF